MGLAAKSLNFIVVFICNGPLKIVHLIIIVIIRQLFHPRRWNRFTSDRYRNNNQLFLYVLQVWCATVANAVTPRRWFVDRVLMKGMLAYRAKGRAAAATAEKDEALPGKRSI